MKEKMKWINGVGVYFHTLYSLNKNVLKLCNCDAFEMYEIQSIVMEISINLNTLIPFNVHESSKKIELLNEGMLSFGKDISFVKDDYKKIIEKRYVVFNTIKKLRNKSLHEPHLVKIASTGSGSASLPDAKFKVKNKEFQIKTEEFVEIVKSLNEIFDKVSNEVEKSSNEEWKEHPYIKKITGFQFSNFNHLLESEVVKQVGFITREY